MLFIYRTVSYEDGESPETMTNELSISGIPREMVPGIMTISRMAGLMAHWRETMSRDFHFCSPNRAKLPATDVRSI